MRTIRMAGLVLCVGFGCLADDVSGPNRTTLQSTAWGSFFYEPSKLGSSQVETGAGNFRLISNQGKVEVEGSQAMGFKVSCGRDQMTINDFNFGNLEIRSKDLSFTLTNENGKLTISYARDTLVLYRNANFFSIKGGRGTVSVNSQPDEVTVQSPAGLTKITTTYDRRGISGPGFDRVPYLGRGIYLSFHGLGIFIDVARLFPMPEVMDWVEWKPIL